VRRVNGFAFSQSLAVGNSLKRNLREVLRRLSSFGNDDFSDKRMAGPATHLLGRPGKLLRPSLVFLGAAAIGEDYRCFIDMAVGAEILHTASLVHDDLIDADTTRRGVSSVHSKYGSETAILAGDALIAKGIMLVSKYGFEVTSAMSKAALDMCAGELLDYSLQKDRRLPTTKEYIRIARLKSGSLLGTCCSIVPTYKKSTMAKEMFLFGLNAGIAFQIRDDVIEAIDPHENDVNGNRKKISFKADIVSVVGKSLGTGREDALEGAVALNNYFADRALGSINDNKTRDALSYYADFVRVRKE
jgi:geranylgeranyl pyrophosphate synthase